MPPAKRYHRFEGVDVVRHTRNAVIISIGGVERVVPQSVIYKMERGAEGAHLDEVTIEEWWAKKEFLI